jgi:hypothetical protein
MSWCNIAENVISDVIFLVITILFGWCFFRITRRTQLLKFFGINESRRFVIYLSELKLKQGDTSGIDGKFYSYTGSAVAFGEAQSANKFRDLFNYFLPSLSDVPNFLSKLLISDIQVQLKMSPTNQDEMKYTGSFITFGSPVFNFASKYVEMQLHSKAKFGSKKTALTNSGDVTNLNIIGLVQTYDNPSPRPSGTQIPENLYENRSESSQWINLPTINIENIPPLQESTYGFVERIIDHENKRSVFYVAGISELSTVGAANFLMAEWGKLQQKFGNDKNFLVMIRFEPNDYHRWTKIFEN